MSAPHGGIAEASPLRLATAGYCVDYRLPTCHDLLSLRGDPVAASGNLAMGLVERASFNGEAADATRLPAELYSELARCVVERDPLAHIELLLRCSGCGLDWAETLNVVEYVWRELGAHARNLTAEVAHLAAAFGWTEADILGMTERRRRRYLETLLA